MTKYCHGGLNDAYGASCDDDGDESDRDDHVEVVWACIVADKAFAEAEVAQANHHPSLDRHRHNSARTAAAAVHLLAEAPYQAVGTVEHRPYHHRRTQACLHSPEVPQIVVAAKPMHTVASIVGYSIASTRSVASPYVGT